MKLTPTERYLPTTLSNLVHTTLHINIRILYHHPFNLQDYFYPERSFSTSSSRPLHFTRASDFCYNLLNGPEFWKVTSNIFVNKEPPSGASLIHP